MSHYLRVAVVPFYLMLCLMLGGASAAGFWANMLLQLLALPILVWALVVKRSTPMSTAGRQLCAILVLVLLAIGIQLVPLPPDLWTSLPGRAPIAEGYRLLGQPPPWMPISLAPHRTLGSALWLLPAFAVCLGILRLGSFKANWIAWAVAIVTTLAVGIGAMQVASGDPMKWYFYQTTNVGATTGFFANANHMATLLVATIPFLTALYLVARGRGRSPKASSGMFVVLAGALAVVVVGVVINASLAGVGLAVPVVAASVLMLLTRKRALPRWAGPAVVLLAIVAVTLMFKGPFQTSLASAGAETSFASRQTIFTTSIDAVRDFLPWGSGIGTFAEIYPRYEQPGEVTRWYINHVHGDYIELALETGIVGLAVLLVFAAWWLARIVAIWRADQPDYFARAATIASAAMLAHSVVDYPLRTAAMSALFAACCALMAEPRARVRRSEAPETANQARHLSAD